ncbi:uncharacterized protein LOC128995313 isoform X1 [Macrosteles quadrilineatus]|uniref:uncharacterized protein LOC128995313 isoform X1 n=1 Tax=Macrosteles quadrilineatus TaxID=74068 RepID=UPI0023E299B2|nr:uncharacterized protein LOC128995313 isoform X1 [Macrosteles quadrilineatus]XP_054276268.1 uncharacterized protein LOC128995313 isoform X1 [Macrosteles quadrilineatus]
MKEVNKSINSIETRKIRKILNEEAKLGISPNSDSETEQVDLSKELYPLGYYINNREEMIEQMFSIIKGAKLKKMLPPILRDLPFDELKADCLIHLLGMSKKRIKAILEGKEINSSSDSETHSDDSTPSKKPKMELQPFVIKQEGCSDISDNSEEVVLVDPDLDFLKVSSSDGAKITEGKKKSKRKLKRKELDKKLKRTKVKLHVKTSDTEVFRIDSSAESASEKEEETEAPKEGKTLLEILELEMRARAIRALLKNNEPPENEGPLTALEENKQNPGGSKEQSKKHLDEDTNEKVTPAKNFRKKKRKNDDVIVITPKVVTIDLTDENEHSGFKKTVDNGEPSSSQNIVSKDQSPEVSVNNLSETNKEVVKSSVSECIPVDELLSKAESEISSERVVSSSVVKQTINETEKTPDIDDKNSWAQRWLESKEVKKVVSTSKICGNIRKKIKRAKLAQKQKLVEDKPEIPSPVPQREIEGSVVEYKLLSKPKEISSDIDSAIDDVTQTSVLSENQGPTSSVAELNPTFTADQVEDVTSTRVENHSNDTQEPASGVCIDEVNNLITNKEACVIEVTKTDCQKKEIDVPLTADENQSRIECVNKNINGYQKDESLADLIVINDSSPSNEEKDKVGCESIEHILKFSQNTMLDSIYVNDQTNADGSNNLCHNRSSSEYCESQSLHTKEAINELASNNHILSNELDSNKNATEPVEHNSSLITTTKNVENIQKEITISEVSETLNKIVSGCSVNPSHEQSELETLEINITDDDRDIEETVEETNKLLKNCKDIVVID